MLDDTSRALINRLQDDLPMDSRPFAAVGRELGLTEDEVIARIQEMKEAGAITRFGPFFDAAAMGGAFCLCAMEVPAAQFEEVMIKVNAFPEVAHNYERDHALSMWFVLATETPEGIADTAARIEQDTGIPVWCFPKLQEFFIGFRVNA